MKTWQGASQPGRAGSVHFTSGQSRRTFALVAAAIAGMSTALVAVPASAAPCAVDEYGCIFTNVTSAPQGLTADGMLNTQSSVTISAFVVIPNGSQPGDTLTLTITDPIFQIDAFSGLELADESGTVLATGASSGNELTLTFTSAVALIENAEGTLNFYVRPSLAPTHGETHTLDLTIGGVSIGPNDDYVIAAWGATGTQIDAGPATIGGTELGIVTSTYWRNPTGTTVTGARSVVQAPPGAFPVCEGDYAPRLLWVTNDGGAPVTIPGVDGQSEQRVTIEECDPATGRMVLSVPSDLEVPAGVTAVRFRAWWAGESPQTPYTFTATMSGLYNGQQTTVGDLTDTATTGILAGTAAGDVRPARIAIEKTALNETPVFVGDTVTYDITVTSQEELRTAYDVAVTDTLPEGLEFVSASDGGTHAAGVVSWAPVDLLAGESRTYTVETIATEAAASLTELLNVAVASGSNIICEGDGDGDGEAISDCDDDAIVPIAKPGLGLDKVAKETVDTNGNAVIGDAGDTISYGFTLSNTGNTVLATVLLDDDKLGVVDHECLTEPLPVGGVVECAGVFSYVITDADVTATEVVNVATATTPNVPPVTDEVITPTKPAPAAPVPTTPAPTTAAPVPTTPAKVTPPRAGGLAQTGADGTLVGGLAAAGLLAAGAGATYVVRRRRAAADDAA